MALYKKNNWASKAAEKDIFDAHTFRGKFSGQRCFLCGTGPSLKKANPKSIKDSGYVVMGLNNSFVYIALHIWMGIDEPAAFHKSWSDLSCMKIYQWQRKDDEHQGKRICDYDNMYFFARAGKEDMQKGGLDLTGDHISFLFEGNTFSSAIHVLYWMGFSTVYLIGCDFGGSNYISRTGPLYKKKKYDNAAQAEHLKGALDFLRFSSENNGVNYISCTAGSPINEFLEYKTIKQAAGNAS